MKQVYRFLTLSLIITVMFSSCEKNELVPVEERLLMFEWRAIHVIEYHDLPDTLSTFEEIVTADLLYIYCQHHYNRDHYFHFNENSVIIYEIENDPNSIGWGRDTIDYRSGTYQINGNKISFGDELQDLFEQDFKIPYGHMEFEVVSYFNRLHLGCSYIDETAGGDTLWYSIEIAAQEENNY